AGFDSHAARARPHLPARPPQLGVRHQLITLAPTAVARDDFQTPHQPSPHERASLLVTGSVQVTRLPFLYCHCHQTQSSPSSAPQTDPALAKLASECAVTPFPTDC